MTKKRKLQTNPDANRTDYPQSYGFSYYQILGTRSAIRKDPNSGLYCATDLADYYGRVPGQFSRKVAFENTLSTLSWVTNKPVSEHWRPTHGGDPIMRGTWVSQFMLLELLTWCDEALGTRHKTGVRCSSDWKWLSLLKNDSQTDSTTV